MCETNWCAQSDVSTRDVLVIVVATPNSIVATLITVTHIATTLNFVVATPSHVAATLVLQPLLLQPQFTLLLQF